MALQGTTPYMVIMDDPEKYIWSPFDVAKIKFIKGELLTSTQILLKAISAYPRLVTVQPLIVGGAIASLLQGEQPKDYDTVFSSSGAAVWADKLFKVNPELRETTIKVETGYPNGKFVYNNLNPNLTQGKKFQLIVNLYGKGEKVVSTFDFQHTKTWYNWVEDKLYLSPRTYQCIIHKVLIPTLPPTEAISALRYLKFLDRGYRLHKDVKPFNLYHNRKTMEINIHTPVKYIEEQLIGVNQ